ncbi:ATP-binding cassette domain-containing protein [Pseudomonas chlororaphis subsp. aurantiaca]|uniref:ATP-binding cassette domain-containing protein n=1 Tax=Pseudomonas chlororaphis TaxID=587753 RepID=UPI00398AD050
MAIEIADLNKFYGAFHVLHDTNLKVRQDKRMVLCGLSGFGKSTPIRCINRLEIAERGRSGVGFLELIRLTLAPYPLTLFTIFCWSTAA